MRESLTRADAEPADDTPPVDSTAGVEAEPDEPNEVDVAWSQSPLPTDAMEAAAIASERATVAQIKAIGRAAGIFTRAIASGDRAIKEDFDFHLAIALGTRNSRFVGFLEFLGGPRFFSNQGKLVDRRTIFTARDRILRRIAECVPVGQERIDRECVARRVLHSWRCITKLVQNR